MIDDNYLRDHPGDRIMWSVITIFGMVFCISMALIAILILVVGITGSVNNPGYKHPIGETLGIAFGLFGIPACCCITIGACCGMCAAKILCGCNIIRDCICCMPRLINENIVDPLRENLARRREERERIYVRTINEIEATETSKELEKLRQQKSNNYEAALDLDAITKNTKSSKKTEEALNAEQELKKQEEEQKQREEAYRKEESKREEERKQAEEKRLDDAKECLRNGNKYYNRGEYAVAIENYNEAIRHDPKFANAYNNRGNAYYNLGKYELAKQDYEAALKINPDYENAKKWKQEAEKMLQAEQELRRRKEEEQQREEERRKEEARKSLEELLNEGANEYFCKGNDYCDKSEYKLAIEKYKKALELNPQHEEAASQLKIAYQSYAFSQLKINDSISSWSSAEMKLSWLNKKESKKLISLITNSPKLISLDLSNNSLNQLQFNLLLEYLSKNPLLETLNLTNCDFTKQQIERLTEVISLNNVNLISCRISPNLSYTSEVTKLEKILKRNSEIKKCEVSWQENEAHRQELVKKLNQINLSESITNLELMAQSQDKEYREILDNITNLMEEFNQLTSNLPNYRHLTAPSTGETLNRLINFWLELIKKEDHLEKKHEYYKKALNLHHDFILKNEKILFDIVDSYLDNLCQEPSSLEKLECALTAMDELPNKDNSLNSHYQGIYEQYFKQITLLIEQSKDYKENEKYFALEQQLVNKSSKLINAKIKKLLEKLYLTYVTQQGHYIANTMTNIEKVIPAAESFIRMIIQNTEYLLCNKEAKAKIKLELENIIVGIADKYCNSMGYQEKLFVLLEQYIPLERRNESKVLEVICKLAKCYLQKQLPLLNSQLNKTNSLVDIINIFNQEIENNNLATRVDEERKFLQKVSAYKTTNSQTTILKYISQLPQNEIVQWGLFSESNNNINTNVKKSISISLPPLIQSQFCAHNNNEDKEVFKFGIGAYILSLVQINGEDHVFFILEGVEKNQLLLGKYHLTTPDMQKTAIKIDEKNPEFMEQTTCLRELLKGSREQAATKYYYLSFLIDHNQKGIFIQNVRETEKNPPEYSRYAVQNKRHNQMIEACQKIFNISSDERKNCFVWGVDMLEKINIDLTQNEQCTLNKPKSWLQFTNSMVLIPQAYLCKNLAEFPEFKEGQQFKKGIS